MSGWAIPSLSAEERKVNLGVLAMTAATVELPYALVLVPRLSELGWIEGKNLEIIRRFADPKTLGYGGAIADLLRQEVDVIYAMAAPASKAAAEATRTTPIVMLDYTNDPVAAGYAERYSQPGRNMTGVFLDAPEFAGKWLQLLRDLVPGLKSLAVLWDPAPGRNHRDAIERVAGTAGLKVEVHEARTLQQCKEALGRMRGRSQAVAILPSPMTFTYAEELARWTREYRVPATHVAKKFAESGGAISYGPDIIESTMRNAAQIARIFSGVKPGAIPIERPFKYDFLINTKTVEVLKLRLPDHLAVGAELVR